MKITSIIRRLVKGIVMMTVKATIACKKGAELWVGKGTGTQMTTTILPLTIIRSHK